MFSKFLHGRSRTQKQKTRLVCEALEDRRVLATFTVADLADTADANPGDGIAADAAGVTTLRAAIEEANALAGADNIDFSVSGTVNLTMGALSVASELDIDGGGNITIDGQSNSTVLELTGSAVSTVSNLIIANGSATKGGGINSAGDLTLSSAVVLDSAATEMGGGIYSSGSLAITNLSVITGNSAGTTGTAYGGGIASYGGSLTIDNSTVSQNSSTQYGGGVFAAQGTVQVLNNSSITGNSVVNTTGAYSSGGGISVASGTYGGGGAIAFDLTIDNSNISDNTLDGTNFPYGAGVYSFGFGSVSITNSTITGNRNEGTGGARGGAGFNWPAAGISPGTLYIDIEDTVIEDNYSFEESGGFGLRGQSADANVVMTVERSQIMNNTAYGAGGGGFLWTGGGTDPAAATLNIVESVISGNFTFGTGGGIEVQNNVVNITDSTIDDNYASANGGGIYTATGGIDTTGYSPGITTITRSTISNNYSAGSGGAVYAYDVDLVVENSTISGNNSLALGGGITKTVAPTYVGTIYDSTVSINNSTITNNDSGAGAGGLHANAYASSGASNSIISGNTGVTTDFTATLPPSVSYSLIGDGTGSTLAPANPDANGNIVGDTASPIDALLGALGMNGGNTLTHLPMAGSPAIDAGDPAFAGGVDQTGNSRVNDGRVDMGSVETGMSSITEDFDGDGDADCADINALSLASSLGTNDPMFDLNGDTLVNAADIDAWLIAAGARPEYAASTGGNPFFVGDADLDGNVNGQDFVIWNNAKFTTNANFCDGDFNGDGFVNGQDFVAWNSNKFKSSLTDGSGPVQTGEPAATLANQFGRTETTGKRSLRAKQPRLARAQDVPQVVATDVVHDVALAAGTTQLVGQTIATPASPDSPLRVQSVRGFDSIANHDDRHEESSDHIFAALGSEL
jgi:predicted outer membrane repeat protein